MGYRECKEAVHQKAKYDERVRRANRAVRLLEEMRERDAEGITSLEVRCPCCGRTLRVAVELMMREADDED